MEHRMLSRREFVRTLSGAVAGGGLITAAFAGCSLTSAQKAEATEAMVDSLGQLAKRPFGKHMGGMKITPVVICQDWNPSLYEPALKLGINYVHKAGYWGSLPEPFKKLHRESYYTDITVDSTPNNPDDEEGAYRQVTAALQRTGLGYFDIFKAHYGWKSVREMKERRGTHRAFDRLKREGKVKYFGVSQHDYVAYPEIIEAEIKEGLIDTMQVFYSYGTPDPTAQIFDAARKAGVAMLAMKVFANGNGRMRGDSAKQAEMKAPGMVGRSLIRYALSAKVSDAPIFQSCVTNLQSFEQFEENVGAVAAKVARADGFEVLA